MFNLGVRKKKKIIWIYKHYCRFTVRVFVLPPPPPCCTAAVLHYNIIIIRPTRRYRTRLRGSCMLFYFIFFNSSSAYTYSRYKKQESCCRYITRPSPVGNGFSNKVTDRKPVFLFRCILSSFFFFYVIVHIIIMLEY